MMNERPKREFRVDPDACQKEIQKLKNMNVQLGHQKQQLEALMDQNVKNIQQLQASLQRELALRRRDERERARGNRIQRDR